MGYEM